VSSLLFLDLGLLGLGHHQVVGELLIRGLGQGGGLPEIGSEVLVGVTQGSEGSLHGVTTGLGVTAGGGVDIGDTGESHKLLCGRGADNTGTARGRDQTHGNGTTLARDLHGDGVGETETRAPVTATDRDQVDLGSHQTTGDGVGNFLGGLDTKADVARAIANADESLETVALTGGGLLLDGHDLHDVILEDARADRGEATATFLVLGEENVDDLRFLDAQRVEVDVLDGGNLTVEHQTAELGQRDPGVATLTLLALLAALLAALALAFAILAFAEAAAETAFFATHSCKINISNRK